MVTGKEEKRRKNGSCKNMKRRKKEKEKKERKEMVLREKEEKKEKEKKGKGKKNEMCGPPFSIIREGITKFMKLPTYPYIKI